MVWAYEQILGHDEEPILQMGTDKMIPRYAFHKPFMVRLTGLELPSIPDDTG
jgi:hypothetical protein